MIDDINPSIDDKVLSIEEHARRGVEIELLSDEALHSIRSQFEHIALRTDEHGIQLLEETFGIIESSFSLLHKQTALIQALVRIAQDAVAQRDDAIEQAGEIVHALNNPYTVDNDLVRNLMIQIVDNHNAAFWESLPYDMAYALGEEWQHWEADDLYMAITIDLDEKEDGPGDYGYSKEALIAFRQALHNAVKRLATSGEDPS